MLRSVVGFEQDNDQHWRAILDCGHHQHVRHDPPLISREWVLTPTGRDRMIGGELDCRRCDEVEKRNEAA